MNGNPENYKLGLFYFNRSDDRIFVPKMISRTGWTINFARPGSYLFIIGLVLLIVLFSYL
jgi:uncharacterized membrane protein